MKFKMISPAILAFSIISTVVTAASYDPAAIVSAALPSTSSSNESTLDAPQLNALSSVNKNHFYVGAGAGGIGVSNIWTNHASTDFAHPENDPDPTYTIDFNNTMTIDAGNIGWNSTFFAGYAWYLPKRTFLGVEVFDNITNTAASTDEQPSTVYTDNGDAGSFARDLSVSLTLQNVYGVRALPGFQVTQDTVVYGIIGWARAHATTNASYSLNASIDADKVQLPGSSIDGEYNFNGYQLGLGSMINLTEHLALRSDLIYTAYNTVTLNGGVDVDPDGSTNTMKITSDLTTIEADISLVYMFG